jgi:hypothetical protein
VFNQFCSNNEKRLYVSFYQGSKPRVPNVRGKNNIGPTQLNTQPTSNSTRHLTQTSWAAKKTFSALLDLVYKLSVSTSLMGMKSKYNFLNQCYNNIVKLIIDLIPAKHSMSKDFTSQRRCICISISRPGVLLESKSVGVFSHIYTLSFSKENTTN